MQELENDLVVTESINKCTKVERKRYIVKGGHKNDLNEFCIIFSWLCASNFKVSDMDTETFDLMNTMPCVRPFYDCNQIQKSTHNRQSGNCIHHVEKFTTLSLLASCNISQRQNMSFS